MRNQREFEIRPATPRDAHGIATVHVKSWQAAYRGLLSDRLLDNLDSTLERRANYWRTVADDPEHDLFVADQANQIVAFGSISACRDEDMGPEVGELLTIYALKEVWGHGIGYAMYEALDAALIARQFTQVNLWVLAGNDRAIRFYERNGFVRDTSPHGIKTEQVREETLTEWRFSKAVTSDR